MNRVQRARHILLQGNFLAAYELTQEQYETVTNPTIKDNVILALHDALTGGHLSSRVQNSLDDGPFSCLDEIHAEEEISDDDEGLEPERVTKPIIPLSLTPSPV